jgi:hypothetical protein
MSGIQRFGPFITIGINLVVCGAIVYYFHRRLLSVESAFIKQNQIFSSFMVEFKRDINMQLQMQQQHPSSQQQKMYKEESGDVTELASPEAIKAVSINNKIEVSDDSESDSDSDSDSESDSESDAGSASEADASEAEEEIKTIDLTNMDINDDHLYINEADLGLSNQEIFQDMMNASMMSNSFMHSSGLSGSFVIISDTNNITSEDNKKIIILNDEESSSSSDSDDEAEEEPLKIIKKSTPPPTPLIQTIDLESVSVIELQEEEETPAVIKKPVKAKKNIVLMDMETGIIEATAEATATSKELSSIENMKVDDLRKLAVDKNLVTKENVKKMKKAELLTLLSQ